MSTRKYPVKYWVLQDGFNEFSVVGHEYTKISGNIYKLPFIQLMTTGKYYESGFLIVFRYGVGDIKCNREIINNPRYQFLCVCMRLITSSVNNRSSLYLLHYKYDRSSVAQGKPIKLETVWCFSALKVKKPDESYPSELIEDLISDIRLAMSMYKLQLYYESKTTPTA